MKIESAAQAEEMLRALAEYYREPVMPIRQYCNALETWAACIQMNNGLRPSMVPEGFAMPQRGDGHGVSYVAILQGMLTDIRKSNLLYRLLYRGQVLRKRPCPQHRGHWSGWSNEPCPHGCSDGMNVTGWLPETAVEPPAPKMPRIERRPRIEYKDPEGKACSVVLPREGGFLGRVAESLISYADVRMSRRQCRFFQGEDGFWYVEDKHSTGGTVLNAQRLTDPTRLRPGDIIRVANLEFRYVE